MDTMPKKCVCGHDRVAHQHYRGGSDCASCAEHGCPGFVGDTVAGRLLGTLLNRRQRPSATTRRAEPIDIRRGAA